MALTRHVTEYSLNKTGEYQRDILQLPKTARVGKYLTDNKLNSLHLAGKHARIFVLGHYIFSFSSCVLGKLFASRPFW